ncbi:unnamed protein product [Ectocarpus fasciculatus]
MSPLFATLLLDRDYAGLTSLTDFKFVATSLRMLRDEFNCRPQLTAEQFLTSGFAEVKMRLLADIVELVMRTHHSLASQQKNEGGGASSSNNISSSSNASAPVPSTGNGWGAKSDHSGGPSPPAAAAAAAAATAASLCATAAAAAAVLPARLGGGPFQRGWLLDRAPAAAPLAAAPVRRAHRDGER